MRDRFGKLQGDPVRFPSGMKWLADEMHSRGLKLGLYGCPGVRTCEGFPGQFEHEYQDAETLAEWGIDWWKYDNCWQEWATVEMYSGTTRTGQNSWPSTEQAIDQLLKSLTCKSTSNALRCLWASLTDCLRLQTRSTSRSSLTDCLCLQTRSTSVASARTGRMRTQ